MTIFGIRCEFSNELIMKDFLLMTFLILVSLFTMPVVSYAQRYEADYLIGNYIRAYRTDADGSKWRKLIPNGTVIQVDRRIVAADSTSAGRNMLAEFTYEGETYLTEARWLRFSESNPQETVDIFAGDDFSPTDSFVRKRLAFTRMNPLSPLGRFMYGLSLPLAQLLLMASALLMLLRCRKAGWSAMPFVVAVALQVYSALMLGNDALWWCMPEYQGLGGAIVGFIPLALYLGMELAYVILIRTFISAGAGSGFARGAARAALMVIGVFGLIATLSAAYFAGMLILAEVVLACPVLAFLIAGMAKNIRRLYWHNPDGSVSDIYGNRYNSEDEARDAWRNRNATAQ